MFRYLRSAPKFLRSCLASPRRRLSRKEEFLRPLQLEKLEDRSLLAGVNLNEAITILLADFSQVPPSQTQEFTYADVTVGSSVGGGTADLDLKNVTLKFPDLAFEAGQWTGNVTVAAQTGVLFPGLLNVAVTDDGTDIAKGNDADLFGVVGTINVAPNNGTSYLKLDPIDAENIGVPAFLDASLQNLRLNFTDFRSDDNLNSLHLEVALKGFDTGDAFLNTQLQTGSNPFIQISVQGFASGDLNLPTIENAATNLATFKDALFHETLAQIDGFGGKINGKLMKLGYIKADFLFHQITVDGKTSGYIAVEGGMTFGDDAFGRSGDFEVALAISDLGPLQIFALGGPIKTPWGIEIEEARFGTIFNQTIEGLRTTIDAAAIAAEVVPEGTSSSRVTLTMSPAKKHDLVVGDHFRITGSANTAYNGDFTVAAVVGDKVTYIDGYHTPAALAVLGPFTGSANIIRLTIRTPLDLRDGGITISPPRSMFDWRNQLDLQVTNQIRAGANVWNQLFGKAIFGGGATITIEGISGKLLKVNADVALDTNGGIFLSGNLSLGGGAARIPAYMYADLTKLQIGAAKFLFLADIPKITGVVHDPLLVYRGSVGFQALVNGAPIGLDPSGLPAGVGINVTSATVTGTGPWTTTFTLAMPAGTMASDRFQVGDTLVVVKSNPDQFDGEHIITAVNDSAGTISFRIGSAVKNGGIDVNLDGIINTADDGLFGEIPVIDGKLDIDRNGIVDSNDIGGVSRFDFNLATTDDLTDYQRVDYKVINGLVDIDNDGNVSADSGDVGAIGADPGTWVAGSAVANQNALGDGFRITLEGGIDLNIPEVTTISLESVTPATLDFTIPGPGSVIDARMDISFDGQLRETNVGPIARFAGNFHVTLDTDIPVDATHPVGGVEIWGAGLLTTDFKFLEKYGLTANATAVLRINSSDVDKEELLPVANQATPVTVALPAKSFALRLDGSLDFRIDFDQDTVFELDESMALFNGIFVFEFSADQGFNVAIFNENAGIVGPAALQIGPPVSGSRLLTAQTLGNLAIRSNGVAAHIYVGMSAATPSELPLDLAELSGQAVLVVNTTGQPVTFKVPGASGSNRPAAGSTLVIPAAAPANPSSILGAASSAPNPQFEALKTGSPTWVAQPSAGPYGVMFIKGHINLAGILEKELAGYVLLSKSVVSMEANFKAERSFLNLASGSVSGRMFYSSQGEFELEAHGDVQLGPDGFNIAGHANLFISYLDSDLKGSAGVDPKTLIITGDLSVEATVFYVPLGTIGLDVAYKEPTLTVGVTVSVPDIAWTSPDPVFGVSWPYPTLVAKKYTFTVGTFTVNPTPPPPVYLASNMGGGVLRLNVGPNATVRNYNTEEKDEAVAISHLGAGTVSGEKIQITMFGISQEYDNVSSISADMGDGNDFLSINSGVTVPVVAYLGVGTDTLTNKSAAFVTAYGEGDRDSLTGGSGIDWLYGGGDNDTIDGGAGADVIEGGTENDFLIGGDGIDTIKGDDGQDLIAGDLGGITGTTAGIVFSSAASANGGADTIYGGQGADIIFGGSGGDTIYGESERDTLLGGDGQATIVSTTNGSTNESTTVVVALALGSDGADEFRWTVGNGNDIIDGQTGTDTLVIYGTDGSAEQVAISVKSAGFTAAVGTESLSVDGVEVSNIEGRGGSDSFTVNDLTGSVLQQINLKLGSDSVQDTVVVNGSANSDVFTIATSLSALRVQKAGGVTIDVFNTSSTSGGDTITLNTQAGTDTINVRGNLVGTLTTVNGGDGGDLIQVGSNATALANTGGNLQGIVGSLTIAGDGGLDVLSLDDTVDTTTNTGTLTATQITGLGMGSTGITYAGVETLVVSLGSGGDTFTVENTAGTANTINTGNGIDNVTVNATGTGSLILNGQADADTFNINLGSLAAIVSVSDTGASGSDALNINGIVGANNIVLDLATITSGTELVNYTGIETLRIDTHDGADAFIIKDNGARTTINSGKGEDEFTIGPAVNEDGEVLDDNENGTNTDEQAIKGTSLWMMINAGDDNDDFEVNRNTGELYLNGENGNDVFVLNTLITGGDSTVDGGGDADEITYLQNAPVYINGGSGIDTVIVNGSKLNDRFIITGTTIEVVGSRVVSFDEIESLVVNGRKGLDTFAVDTTIDGAGNPLATSALKTLAVDGQLDDDTVELRGMLTDIIATFSGGEGNDTFNLQSLAPLTVNAIDGPVTINGDDGQDTLNVYDTGDTTANIGTLTATTLNGLGMDSGVTYGTLEGLRISLGSGGNTFTIQDTHTGLTFLNSGSGADTVNVKAVLGTTTVNAEAGNDTINVGSLAPAAGGAVNQIASALFVNGGGANLDTLNVDDTGDATPNDGVLTKTTLTGLGMGFGITYSNLEVLNISLGAGGNTFNVKATSAGTATTLNSGNGDDILTIDSNGASAYGTVNCVVSSLTINGQDGINVLTMEDYSDTTGDKVHVTPTQIGAAASDTFFGTGGLLTYSDLDQVTLNMSQAYSPDTICLTPSRLSTEFFIRGRGPQTPMQRAQLNGDTLYQDFTGLTAAERLGVSLNATGLNNPADPVFNVWTIPGHGKVNYKQIEKMNHVQTLAVGADVGGQEPRVKVIDAETGLQKLSFLAFAAGFKGGVRVAVGDVNGDAIPDIITSAGPGGGPHVRVFNGANGVRFTEPIGDFFAFAAGSKTTVQVAAGDINLDGLADIITGSDSGGEPIVKVFDANKLLTGQPNPVVSQFFAYDRNFAGGVRLAVGDLDNDGVLDIATGPGSGLNSQVRIFKTNLGTNQAIISQPLLTSFSAFPNYNGGVHLAVGDVNGDRRADLVVGTASGGTAMTRIYNGATIGSGTPPALLADFKPYGTQAGGVRVALVDVDGDGVNELITASALTGSKVKPKAFRIHPNGPIALTPAAIDAVFAGFASDPFFQGALFLGGGN